MSSVDLEALDTLVEQGYLRKQEHHRYPLTLYNYTEKTQYEKHWTPETLMCRGLIVNDVGKVIARPFPKFFNLDEWVSMGNEIPDESYVATEKMDGSLIILTPYKRDLLISTRGSFTSEQALKAAEMLKKSSAKSLFLPGVTYLMEVIYPENRIVVDYGTEEKLVLLAMIDSATGKEYSPTPAWKHYPPVEPVSEIPSVKLDDWVTLAEPNREGLVIRFKSGLRLKLKFEEYVRLHKLVTGISSVTIWEHLRDNNGAIHELLQDVPDELYRWVEHTALLLNMDYDVILGDAYHCLRDCQDLPTRKEQAHHILNSPAKEYAGVVFALLDGKDPDPIIWKMLKPEKSLPFKRKEVDEEE